MHTRVTVLLAALLWLGAGEATAQGAGGMIQNPQVGFRFSYPAGWSAAEPKGLDVRAMVTSGPSATCAIAVHEADEFRGLSQAQLDWSISNHPFGPDDWAKSLAGRFSDVAVRSPTVTKINNRPVRVATATARDETGMPTVLLMFHALSPGRAWHFTCGAQAADLGAAEAVFVARRIDFQRIISTFFWLD